MSIRSCLGVIPSGFSDAWWSEGAIDILIYKEGVNQPSGTGLEVNPCPVVLILFGTLHAGSCLKSASCIWGLPRGSSRLSISLLQVPSDP